MTQHRSTILVLLAAVLISGVWYFQYRYHRTPVSILETLTPAIVIGGIVKDGIPAITEPDYESVAAADVYLENDGLGIVVAENGYARFYPYQILVWHEVVNATFRGQEILVTYCPLTFSPAVYARTLGEEVFSFGVSGKIIDSNTLLYDTTTESLWSQLKGESVDGELMGLSLTRLPSEIMTWSTFKLGYPYGEVLSRDTDADRDYTQNPYAREGYDDSAAVWFPLSHEDERLPAKTIVYGYEENNRIIAYTVDYIQEENDKRILRPAYWFAWASAYPETEIYQP